jgi:WD40 repeat protein
MSVNTLSSGTGQEFRAPGKPSFPWRVYGDRPFCTDGDVAALAFSADGSLWSVEEPGVLRQWNVATGDAVAWFPLSDLATVWAFSPDGRLLVSGSDELALWDVATGVLRAALIQTSWVTAIGICSDGARLATGHDDGTVRLWDLRSKQQLQEWEGHFRAVSALSFRPDGKVLASAGEDKTICLWDADRAQPQGKLSGHTDRIPALVWHLDGRRLFSAGWDTTARVWDTETREPIILLNSHATQVLSLALSPDGKLLATADSADAIHVWDTARYRPVHVLRGHDGEVRCLAFNGDGTRLASGGEDRAILLWDPRAGALNSRRADPGVARASMAVSPDGNRIAALGREDRLQIWDTASGQSVGELDAADALHVVAYSPNGDRIAAGGIRGLHVWDAADVSDRRTLEGQSSAVTALAFAPDGKVVASASDASPDVWLWNFNTGEPELIIPEMVDSCLVQALAYHPDSRVLAAGGVDWMATSGSDGAVALWDLATRTRLAILPGATTSLAFDPTGTLLAVASLERTIQVWNVATLCVVAELEGHEGTITSVAFSPDGNWLATGSDDHTVRLWDVASRCAGRVIRLDTRVKALAFAPKGRRLYTSNGNASCYGIDLSI